VNSDSGSNVVPARSRIAAFHQHGRPPAAFGALFIDGLRAVQKSIAGAALFDRRSEAFRQLCTLPEYYIERCELEILRDQASELAATIGEDAQLIDLGQNFGPQVDQLLGSLDRPWGYVAVDRDGEALRRDAERVQARHPRLWVEAVCADTRIAFDLPPNAGGGNRIAYLPGNAIGNVPPREALSLLSLWAGQLRSGGMMLVGVDLKKSLLIVESAYDDPLGLNAALMIDMLRRANRELGADFDVRLFEHRVHFEAHSGRVRADLVSIAAHDVRVGNEIFHFEPGERIHVGDSWKYSLEDFRAIAHGAGFRAVRHWLDRREMFSLHLLAAS